MVSLTLGHVVLQPITNLQNHSLRCRICANDEGNRLHCIREMMFGSREPFNYVECARCGCVQLVGSVSNPSAYYPDNYYSFSPTTSTHWGGRLKKLRRRVRKRYEATGQGIIGRMLYRNRPLSELSVLQPLGLRTATRIMDVGCGVGGMLDDLAQAGFKNLYGIDPFNSADVDRPNGVRIDRKTIFACERQADVIMFHHSFEHMENPRETLTRTRDLLTEKGWCLLRVPTASSYAWQHYGADWVQLDAPRHYFLHTIKSIELLAADTGFHIEKITYDSTAFQFWGSEQYRNGIPLRNERSYAENPDRSIFSPQDIANFQDQAVELNQCQQGDQAAFYLSRA